MIEIVISPSSRARCKLCDQCIQKGERRVNFSGYLPYGHTHECYHVHCLKGLLEAKNIAKFINASAHKAREAAKAEERQEDTNCFADTVDGIAHAVMKVRDAVAARAKSIRNGSK